jgi:hypothetical protein
VSPRSSSDQHGAICIYLRRVRVAQIALMTR